MDDSFADHKLFSRLIAVLHPLSSGKWDGQDHLDLLISLKCDVVDVLVAAKAWRLKAGQDDTAETDKLEACIDVLLCARGGYGP